MFKRLPVVIGCMGLVAVSAMADKALTGQKEKASYIIGAEVAKQLIVSKDDLDLDAFKLGMKDVFENVKPRLTAEEMQSVMQTFQMNKQQKEQAMMKQFAQQNKAEGAAYLAANKKKEGVKTLPSGLQYKVLKSGKGSASPTIDDQVVAHYHGTLIDGTVFDSSIERGEPVTFPVNGVIKGWTEALQKMKVGDKWQLVIPSELAYGDRGAPPKIAPGSVLIFDVELLEIKKG